jgi:hypothetical protein
MPGWELYITVVEEARAEGLEQAAQLVESWLRPPPCPPEVGCISCSTVRELAAAIRGLKRPAGGAS